MSTSNNVLIFLDAQQQLKHEDDISLMFHYMVIGLKLMLAICNKQFIMKHTKTQCGLSTDDSVSDKSELNSESRE